MNRNFNTILFTLAGNTTAELCTRWHQLGAFYTLSLNHNAPKVVPQEPYAFGNETAMIIRDVLLIRYRLLPYFYTLFYHAHREGSTVLRPLFFEFSGTSIHVIKNGRR